MGVCDFANVTESVELMSDAHHSSTKQLLKRKILTKVNMVPPKKRRYPDNRYVNRDYHVFVSLQQVRAYQIATERLKMSMSACQ